MDGGRLLDLCNDGLTRARRAGADEAEAVAGWRRGVDTRIENGDIHTVETSEETVIGLRVMISGSVGFTTANGLESSTLDACVEEAVGQARITPPDANTGLPPACETTAIERLHDPRIAAIDVTSTTAMATRMIERIRERDARVRIDSGGVSAGESTVALATTTGNSHHEAGTSCGGHLFGMAVDGDEVASFDYDGESTRDFDRIDAALEEMTDRFANKCLSGLGSGSGQSFNGSVVLSPEAVAEFLLPNLIGAICSDAVRKGRSPLAGRVGESIAVPGFTLIDDGTIPGGIASSAFDREGVPTRRMTLIDSGVLTTYLYNHYEAQFAGDGQFSTGHASGSASSLPGIGPNALEVAAGTTPAAELAAGSDPVVWVGRFSGSTNGVTGDFSGVVKNGFLIGNGERRPIRETMIAGNLFEALRNIEAISAERRLLGGSALLPSMRIGGISVTAG